MYWRFLLVKGSGRTSSPLTPFTYTAVALNLRQDLNDWMPSLVDVSFELIICLESSAFFFSLTSIPFLGKNGSKKTEGVGEAICCGTQAAGWILDVGL